MTTSEDDLTTEARARIGTVLRSKYRIDALLGAGGMAVVYRATHRNQAEFAVKMLHSELSRLEDVRVRFLREGYAANSVKHPGAVMVVDDDVADDGAAFLVMELLHGAPVESLWEQAGGRLPIRAVLAVGDQLLDVLAAAHEKGIVHRDIKPANLFAMKDGTLKVLDFGIARVKDATGAASGQQTGTGLLLGTPAFMAPEQAYAKASEIDGQTDVWSAGATLFTLLSGQSVHVGDNAAQLMIHAATARARPLASVAPEVPPGLAEVVDRALAFEKGERWPTAAAMRAALSKVSVDLFQEAPSKHALAALGMTPVRAPWDATKGPRPAPLPATPERVSVPVAQPARDSGFGPTYAQSTPEPALGAPRLRLDAPVAVVQAEEGLGVAGAGSVAEPAPVVSAVTSGPRVSRSELVGGTTAQPFSSEPMPPLPVHGGMGRGVLIGAAALVVLAGGGFALQGTLATQPKPSAAAGLVSSAAPPVAPASSAEPATSAATPATAESAVVASATVLPPTPRPSKAVQRTAATAPSPAPATRAPSPPAQRATNCNPPTWTDTAGFVHIKPGCE